MIYFLLNGSWQVHGRDVYSCLVADSLENHDQDDISLGPLLVTSGVYVNNYCCLATVESTYNMIYSCGPHS